MITNSHFLHLAVTLGSSVTTKLSPQTLNFLFFELSTIAEEESFFPLSTTELPSFCFLRKSKLIACKLNMTHSEKSLLCGNYLCACEQNSNAMLVGIVAGCCYNSFFLFLFWRTRSHVRCVGIVCMRLFVFSRPVPRKAPNHPCCFLS